MYSKKKGEEKKEETWFFYDLQTGKVLTMGAEEEVKSYGLMTMQMAMLIQQRYPLGQQFPLNQN